MSKLFNFRYEIEEEGPVQQITYASETESGYLRLVPEEERKPHSPDKPTTTVQKYESRISVDKKVEKDIPQPEQFYPPWTRETQWEQNTTMTAEGRQIPQPSDQTFETSISVDTKPDDETGPPQLTFPPWVKAKLVDKTMTSIEQQRGQGPEQPMDETDETSITVGVKPSDLRKQPEEGLTPWVRETDYEETTTTKYTTEGRHVPKQPDQTYETSVLVDKTPDQTGVKPLKPGKKPVVPVSPPRLFPFGYMLCIL